MCTTPPAPPLAPPPLHGAPLPAPPGELVSPSTFPSCCCPWRSASGLLCVRDFELPIRGSPPPSPSLFFFPLFPHAASASYLLFVLSRPFACTRTYDSGGCRASLGFVHLACFPLSRFFILPLRCSSHPPPSPLDRRRPPLLCLDSPFPSLAGPSSLCFPSSPSSLSRCVHVCVCEPMRALYKH